MNKLLIGHRKSSCSRSKINNIYVPFSTDYYHFKIMMIYSRRFKYPIMYIRELISSYHYQNIIDNESIGLIGDMKILLGRYHIWRIMDRSERILLCSNCHPEVIPLITYRSNITCNLCRRQSTNWSTCTMDKFNKNINKILDAEYLKYLGYKQ